MEDVYNEIDTVLTRQRVGMYKIKPCTRKYAFEKTDIPKEAEYMKLLYPYDSKIGRLKHKFELTGFRTSSSYRHLRRNIL